MATATKAVKTLTGGDKAMFILEPGVLFQRKTNLPDNWKKVRIGLIGSFTNLVSNNGTPNAETLADQTNLKNVPILGMSNGIGYPGYDALNKSVGIRGTFDSEYGSAAVTSMAFSTPNWTVTQQNGNHIIANGLSIPSAYPAAAQWCNWRIGDPTATSASMFWLILEINVATSGSLVLTWWHSNATPCTNASDATLMNLLTNPTGYTGYTTGGGTLASALAWWTAAPVACPYFFIRMPFLSNRLRIMNMMIFDTSNYA